MTGQTHHTFPDTVTILMGVYNGAGLLEAQLQSLASQSDVGWRLICSDDGSSDSSREVIRTFANQVPQDVQLTNGPQSGFSANFMSLIAALPPGSGMVAFADQDDIWLKDKLARARVMLADGDQVRPALYCARRWLWNPNNNRSQSTLSFTRPASFRNALIENIAPGNTIVLNAAAAQLARAAAQQAGPVFAHDWWLYLLISGAGGQVITDPGPPCLLYRQHDQNAIGAGTSLCVQAERKLAVLKGAFRDRLRGNLAAILAVEDLLTSENRRLARDFEAARTASLPARLQELARIAPYRQTGLGNLGFWGAALLGRI